MNALLEFLARLPAEERALALHCLDQDRDLATHAEIQAEPLGWSNFKPRPDRPAEFDEQRAFCHARDPMAFLVGGNAAGTTEAAAYKCGLFLLRQQAPPRRNTPFWIISQTYDQVSGVCWQEKLLGHGHIPRCEVEWDRVRWLSEKEQSPKSVPLKPWPGRPGTNWLLEFKSYEQGWQAMQARSIGGFWFSEQFSLAIFLEVLRGTREYNFPGGQFAEFTPVDPELCVWLEKVMDRPPVGWRFYRANTECNRANLAAGWYEQFMDLVPDEMRETRRTGALASYRGLIYPGFNPRIHVLANEAIAFPPGCEHFRALDWGSSEEHPQTCVWGYRDGVGDWWVYDEYWSADQEAITRDHAQEILARSLVWGWPVPKVWDSPEWEILVWQRVAKLVGWPEVEWSEEPGELPPWREVAAEWLELPRPIPPQQTWAVAFADPSRPGEINEFGRLGIPTAPASNDIYAGIDCVRTKLQPHPVTGRPHLFLAARCVHLIEEKRKYRWRKSREATSGLLNPQVAKPQPLKRDDDTVDAERYMIFSAERQRGYIPASESYRHYTERRGIERDDAGSNPAAGAGRFVRH